MAFVWLVVDPARAQFEAVTGFDEMALEIIDHDAPRFA